MALMSASRPSSRSKLRRSNAIWAKPHSCNRRYWNITTYSSSWPVQTKLVAPQSSQIFLPFGQIARKSQASPKVEKWRLYIERVIRARIGARSPNFSPRAPIIRVLRIYCLRRPVQYRRSTWHLKSWNRSSVQKTVTSYKTAAFKSMEARVQVQVPQKRQKLPILIIQCFQKFKIVYQIQCNQQPIPAHRISTRWVHMQLSDTLLFLLTHYAYFIVS